MQEIKSLTALRGIFAMMVLAYHALEIAGVGQFDVLAYGVSGFFGLSGFLLYKIYANNFNVRRFAIRRFFRIVPLLAFAITVMYLNVMDKFTPLWSIYTEEQFYFLVLPIVIWIKPSASWLLALGIFSEIGQRMLPNPATSGLMWIPWSTIPFHFLPFAVGISIAKLNVSPGTVLRKLDTILGNKVLRFFGTISYGIYLLHAPLMWWFGWQVGVMATFVLATVTYFTFEKSMIAWGRDLTQ